MTFTEFVVTAIIRLAHVFAALFIAGMAARLASYPIMWGWGMLP